MHIREGVKKNRQAIYEEYKLKAETLDAEMTSAIKKLDAEARGVEATLQTNLTNARQDYERKLVSSENLLVTSKDPAWVQVSSGSASARLGEQPLSVSAATLREQGGGLTTGGARLQVWRFYWVNGR